MATKKAAAKKPAKKAPKKAAITEAKEAKRGVKGAKKIAEKARTRESLQALSKLGVKEIYLVGNKVTHGTQLKAMQGAGRSDIDLVLTGVVALSAGIDQGLWVKLLPDHSAKFPGVMDNYLPAAKKMQSPLLAPTCLAIPSRSPSLRFLATGPPSVPSSATST